MIVPKATKEQLLSIVAGDYVLAMDSDTRCWGIYPALSKGYRGAQVVPIDVNGELYSKTSYYRYEEPDDMCGSNYVFMRDVHAIFRSVKAAEEAHAKLRELDEAFEEETKAARLKYQLGVLMTIEQNT